MSNFIQKFSKYDFPNYGYIKLPEIKISKEEKEKLNLDINCSNLNFLTALSREGFKQKSNKINKEKYNIYEDRIEYELSIISELGFVDYILLVWQVINKARELNVFIDFGRGSVAGSAVCWLLGISGVDPIEKGLYFERFISKARAGKKYIDGQLYLKGELLADVDINLGDGREKIVQWLNEIYPNRVSKILNLSTFTTRILLKDVYKCLEEASEEQAKHVSDMIESHFGIVESIDDAIEKHKDFKDWAEKYPEVVSISKKISDLMRQTSIHASGYLIGFHELNDLIPLECSKEGEICSSYDMREVSNFFCKLDLLGLANNKIIKNIFANIQEKVENINLDNDPFIYDKFQDGKLLPYGLYQISADCAYGVLNKVKPKNIMELSDVNALARPGALSYVESYVKNDHPCPHPVFESILKKTRMHCLYQESMMQMSTVIGFTLEEAEQLRKIVGKKLVDKVKEWKDKIYQKCEQNGFNKEIGDILWKILEDSAKYSFNLSHSIATSYLSALTVYLKYKYPLQFYTACLIATKDLANPIDEISLIQKELDHFKIKLLPPDILKSKEDFSIEENNIRMPVGSIKGISDKGLEKIHNLKLQINNKLDLFNALITAKIPLNVCTSLILSGCFDSISCGAKRSKLLLELEVYKLLTTKEVILINKFAPQYNFDLLKIIKEMAEILKDEKAKPLIKESRFQTIKTKYEPYKQKFIANSKHELLSAYIFEQTYLGFSYTTSLKEIYSEKCVDLSNLNEVKINQPHDIRFRSAVQIVEVNKRISREKKKPYLLLIVKDGTETKKMMLFGEDKINAIREFNGRDLEEDDIVIINGIVKNNTDAIFLESLSIQEFPVILKKSQLKQLENI